VVRAGEGEGAGGRDGVGWYGSKARPIVERAYINSREELCLWQPCGTGLV
jgi:hypothetical protein